MIARTALRRGLKLGSTGTGRLSTMHLVLKRSYVQSSSLSSSIPVVMGGSTSTTLRSFATTPRRLATEIKAYLLADVGEGITECEIIKWFVQPGAVVQEFDPICEVQSDKASVEITSRYAGKIKRLMHKEGDVAKVGHALCEIEMESDGSVGAAEQGKGKAEEEKVEITGVSKESEFKAVDMEGFVSAEEKHSNGGGSSHAAGNGRDVLATPAVRRVSREYNVDLSQVRGTGRDGRITKEDVLNHIENGNTQSSSSSSTSNSTTTTTTSSSSPTPNAPAAGSTETIDLTPVQRAMFKAMTATLTTPHFAYSDEIDVTDLDKVRKLLSSSIPPRYTSAGDASYTKLTLLPLLIKAMSLALHDHPMFRSTLNSEQKLIRRSSHDISIALTSKVGLLTPCISDVQSKSIYDLSGAITRLQTVAASSKGLSPADLRQTGTITLSNIGAVGGGTYTHPLLPPTGQLAIGALGRTRILPRFASEIPSLNDSNQDKIVRRLIISVSFTADHRVVEGALLAKLVNSWKLLVENPSLWIGLLT